MKIIDFQIYRIDLQTRIPFKYGIATMTRVPEIFVRLRAEFGNGESTGFASDCLPPKWFTKIPDKPLDAEIDEMLLVIRRALETSRKISVPSLFAFWKALYDEQDQWARQRTMPPLLAHFGTSLVERALIDAFCRLSRVTFAQAVQGGLFKIDLGELRPELRGRTPADFLPKTPLSKVIARHTIGLADALTDDEIPPTERLNDGLPQSLEASVRRYGLKHFKVKVNGQLANDLTRLKRIAGILHSQCGSKYAFTLDANEQFKSIGDFQAWWRAVRAEPMLDGLWERLLFVEQPVHRDFALRPEVAAEFKSWRQRPPIIIDESDGSLDAVSTALRLAYAGASHKNCKGVIKGIANRCLIAQSGANLIMSGEDLCNIGPVALQQDLAVMAVLGIDSVERNGHHYHAGLSQFPAGIQEQVATNQSDLYRRSGSGWPTVAIANGEIKLTTVNAAPFGVGFLLDPKGLTPIALPLDSVP
ncbi:MAG: hypothetical protein L0Y58_15135 [Verrucomicrobia subdivision 3 bacterium]|nr:hypothetical protein [Limisphaerales bacterium]